MNDKKLLRRIRILILLFIVVLLLSGITVFPLRSELKWLIGTGFFDVHGLIGEWLNRVYTGIDSLLTQYPFLYYGFDWLAFAHIVIAILFIGPYKDPVRNKWVIEWGMITCILVIPLALIAGTMRGIPMFHIFIDCSFGIIGIIPLWMVRKWTRKLESYMISS